MGDTHHDPTDHVRTTHPRAGLLVKDNFLWPGLILLGIALLGMLSTVLVAAYDNYEWIEATVLISVLGTIAGALWLLVEFRHVTDVDASVARATAARPPEAVAVEGQPQ